MIFLALPYRKEAVMSLAECGQVIKGWVLQKQKVRSHFGSDSSNMSWVFFFFFYVQTCHSEPKMVNSVDNLMNETRNYS